MNYDAVEQARSYLLDKIGSAPQIAIILGSGLSAVDEIMTGSSRVNYASIPHFPIPTVAGHRGQMIHGKAGNLKVVVFEGRVHYYEGHGMDKVTFCARVIGRLGTQSLILTNASGAINPCFASGQLMIITDHINLMGVNPLRGANEDRWGVRFVDQTEVYDMTLRTKFREAADYCGIAMVQGVYAALCGPTYETPAEVRYLRTIGADCVGMSTVPEAIVARHMGMRVAGISMLANVAAGPQAKSINHEEVLEAGRQLNAGMGFILQRFFEIYER